VSLVSLPLCLSGWAQQVRERGEEEARGRKEREVEEVEVGKKGEDWKEEKKKKRLLSLKIRIPSPFSPFPSPPASRPSRALALPPFPRLLAIMHSAVARATASGPAAAVASRPGASASNAVAPRPTTTVANARRGSVKANAVKEVIMPALSSTMTEGKVSSAAIELAARMDLTREGGELGERGREEMASLSAFDALSLLAFSLARFGPVASRRGKTDSVCPLFLLEGEPHLLAFLAQLIDLDCELRSRGKGGRDE